jgi:O-antigen/teichoic acid export membrane protein
VIPLTPFRSLTDACQEGYWVNAAAFVQSLVTTALALWLASCDWGISGQMSAVAIGNAIFLGLLGWRRYRRLPRQQDETSSDADREIWRDLRRLNTPILVRRVCGRIGLLSDCLIVSAVLGSSLVVPLYVTQRLAVLVQSQLQGIGSASWAGLAALHARGQFGTFNRRLIELTNAVAILGIAVLTPVVAYNRHFIGRWVGDEHYGGDVLTFVAACNAFLLSLTTLWDWCFAGTGQVARLVPMSLIATAVNVIFSIVLTRWLGLIGPLLGTLMSLALCTIWCLPLLLRRTFHLPLRALFKAVAQPLAWGLPYGALLWWLAGQHDPWGWIGLAAEMAGAAFLFLAIAWVAVFTADERAAWILRLRMFLRFRSTSSTRVPPPVALG